MLFNLPLLTVLAMGLCTSASALRAQWPAPLAPGTRVRAHVPEQQLQAGARRGLLLRGRIAALAPDTLYLAVGDSLGPLPIPRPMIERLDYSRGVPSRASSALRQGLLTAVGMAVLGVLINEGQNAGDQTSTGTAALIGAGFGLTLGGVLGALYPRERWSGVSLGSPSP
jgi:hypothetical protein